MLLRMFENKNHSFNPFEDTAGLNYICPHLFVMDAVVPGDFIYNNKVTPYISNFNTMCYKGNICLNSNTTPWKRINVALREIW